MAQEFTVLDTFRRNRTLKPAGIAELNEGGLALARALAEEVVGAVDAALSPGTPEQGADHA